MQLVHTRSRVHTQTHAQTRAPSRARARRYKTQLIQIHQLPAVGAIDILHIDTADLKRSFVPYPQVRRSQRARPSRGTGRRVPPGAAAHHMVLQNSPPGDVAAQDCLDKLHHLLPQLAARRYAQLMALVNEANVRLTSSHTDVEQFVDYLKFLVIRTPARAALRRAAWTSCLCSAVPVPCLYVSRGGCVHEDVARPLMSRLVPLQAA